MMLWSRVRSFVSQYVDGNLSIQEYGFEKGWMWWCGRRSYVPQSMLPACFDLFVSHFLLYYTALTENISWLCQRRRNFWCNAFRHFLYMWGRNIALLRIQLFLVSASFPFFFIVLSSYQGRGALIALFVVVCTGLTVFLTRTLSFAVLLSCGGTILCSLCVFRACIAAARAERSKFYGRKFSLFLQFMISTILWRSGACLSLSRKCCFALCGSSSIKPPYPDAFSACTYVLCNNHTLSSGSKMCICLVHLSFTHFWIWRSVNSRMYEQSTQPAAMKILTSPYSTDTLYDVGIVSSLRSLALSPSCSS